MKNAVFCAVTPCGCCKICFLRSVIHFPFTVNIVPTSPILVTLMIGVILSSEKSDLTKSHTA
jgi:phospholipid N-methyltransferase